MGQLRKGVAEVERAEGVVWVAWAGVAEGVGVKVVW